MEHTLAVHQLFFSDRNHTNTKTHKKCNLQSIYRKNCKFKCRAITGLEAYLYINLHIYNSIYIIIYIYIQI